MEFYIDIGFAVLLRILRDKKDLTRWRNAFKKLYDAIDIAFNFSGNYTKVDQSLSKD